MHAHWRPGRMGRVLTVLRTVHILATCVWVGGTVVLVFVGVPAIRSLEEKRERPPCARSGSGGDRSAGDRWRWRSCRGCASPTSTAGSTGLRSTPTSTGRRSSSRACRVPRRRRPVPRLRPRPAPAARLRANAPCGARHAPPPHCGRLVHVRPDDRRPDPWRRRARLRRLMETSAAISRSSPARSRSSTRASSCRR